MRKYIKHLCAILILLCASASAWGAAVTTTFTSAAWADANSGWTSVTNGSSFESTGSMRGVANNGVDGACTSKASYSGVYAIDIVASSNAGNNSIKISIGDTEIATKTIYNANNVTYTYDYRDKANIATLSGNVKIKVNHVSSTTYVKSITIHYATSAYAVSFNAGSGSCATASITESAAGYGVTLPSASPSSGCAAEGWTFVGWKRTSAQAETTDVPELFAAETLYHPESNETLFAVYKLGAYYVIDFEASDLSTYSDWDFDHISAHNTSIVPHGGTYHGNTTNTTTSQAVTITTKTALAAPQSLRFYFAKTTSNNTSSSWKVQTSTDKSSWTDRQTQEAASGRNQGQWYEVTQDLSSYTDVYVRISYGTSTAVRAIDDVVLSCATFNSNPSCASCSSAPSVGGAAFESISSGTISVSCDGITNGTGCATTEYGFVWKTGAVAPTSTSDGTKVKVGEGSGGDAGFSTDLSISFTTGTTYRIVPYATNAAGTTLGTAVAVTPRSVTFNSNGGSSVATQYVNNGGTVSAPSDPTNSGFVFGGWFQESGLSTPVDWSAAITADKTYYAKWLTYGNYVFTCAELTLTAHPETADAPIFITSTASKKVRSQGYIQITGSGLTPNTTLTFPSLPGIFEIKTAAYGDLATDATGAIDAAAYIFYTPAADATSDGLDKITGITVTVEGAKTKTVSLTQDIIGRHLPADFVIAGKKDGKWYALPDTMTQTTHPVPIEIAVDNTDNPSVAYTAATNIYNLYGQNSGAGYLEEAGQYVKLGMKNNPTFANYPLLGTTSTAIGKSTGTDPTHNLDKQYWWLFTQTNTSITNPQDAKYIIYCANNTTNHLRLKDNSGNPKWGLYDSGIEEVRLIPASSIVFAEAEIVEWGQHGAIIEVDATAISATKVKAKLNEVASAIVAASQTGTSVKGSATKYNYTAAFGDGLDFAAATSNGATLTLEWYNSSDVMVGVSNIIVPKIIASSATMSSIAPGDAAWSSAEVHVLPGVTLEANAGSFSSGDVTIKHLEIYQGATVNITTGTLTATTLVLRNGWRRIGAKSYDMSRLYITPSDGSLKASNVFADWYIDFDQYYPIAVPWNATIASMSYKNTSSAVSVGPSSSNSVRLRYYDGDSRAKGEGSAAEGDNWKQYGEAGNTAVPAALVPGKAYAMTARRPSGKAFSIIRMPLTLPSGTWSAGSWTSGGEQGNISTTHKDQVTVTAYAYEKTPEYAKGWNFIANPYMANYQGTIEYGDGEKINVVNIPDVDFREYGQYAPTATKLAPASGFLIQAPKDGTLTFGTANRKNAAPSILRTKQADAVPEQQAYILLKDESAEDMMGIFVSEKYTAEYDLNGDVEKLLSNGTSLRTYMHYGDMNMAYVAVNETLAKEWIPVTIRIPETGEYTFSIHEASIAGELEGVYLIDYENGDQVTNLLEENYPFYAENGTISGRFAINAVVGNRVPTAIDAVGAGDATKPVKFIYRDQMYILLNGVIYDATGKKVREINK
ncbi:MAG: InlB B-repeat-containing protein [Paludibacteraceae bacterium]|nr:InlB B-repeat-containing protein [Paludibacteraceae bacterium]